MRATTTTGLTLAAALAALLALPSPAAAQELPGPIPAEWKAAFDAVRADPHPEKLTRDSHYFISDERRHDLFAETIRDKGGVLVAIGPDQNYLFAGWARPEILIPLDFDQMIIDLHFVYRVMFLNAATPAEFIALWNDEGKERALGLIDKEWAGDEKLLKRMRRAYKRSQRLVPRRLKRLVRTSKKQDVPCYLTDQGQYDYVVNLFKTDRVFPIRGDLTKDKALNDISAAVRKVGLTIRTFYLSNAEQYFRYAGTAFKANMLNLPFDEQSLVLRTVGARTDWSADGLYEYVIQDGANLHAWLRHSRTYTVWTIVNEREVNKKTGLSWVRKPPPEEKD